MQWPDSVVLTVGKMRVSPDVAVILTHTSEGYAT
jgi:hypothetical protein